MKIVQIPVDEKLLASAGLDPAQAGEQFRVLAAAKLFELRRLTLAQAADLAALPLAGFMEELGRLGISWINLTDAQVAHDLEMA
jgi:predicted HTH domain antitoxin